MKSIPENYSTVSMQRFSW